LTHPLSPPPTSPPLPCRVQYQSPSEQAIEAHTVDGDGRSQQLSVLPSKGAPREWRGGHPAPRPGGQVSPSGSQKTWAPAPVTRGPTPFGHHPDQTSRPGQPPSTPYRSPVCPVPVIGWPSATGTPPLVGIKAETGLGGAPCRTFYRPGAQRLVSRRGIAPSSPPRPGPRKNSFESSPSTPCEPSATTF